jgi:hypothetical protein
MGNFYVNLTLRGPSQEMVTTAMNGRSAFISPTINGYTVVWDEEADSQDTGEIASLSVRLSRQLDCPLLVVLNHDDDLFFYQLYVSGTLVDSYNSAPGYFSGEPDPPEGGDPGKLCSIYESGTTPEIGRILRPEGDELYCSALERHRALIEALALPIFSVGSGFTYLAAGEVPEGLFAEELIRLAPGFQPKETA